MRCRSMDRLNEDEIITMIKTVGAENLGYLMEILFSKRDQNDRIKDIKLFLFSELHKRFGKNIPIGYACRIMDIIDNFVNNCIQDKNDIDCDKYYSGNTTVTCNACAGIGFITYEGEIEKPLSWLGGNTSRKCNICQGTGYIDPTKSYRDCDCGSV